MPDDMIWKPVILGAGLLLLLLGLVPRPGRRSSAPVGTGPTEASIRAGEEGETRVAEALAGMRGLETIRAFAFETGQGTHRTTCQVDHLLRGVDRIWIIETKNWSGTVLRPHSDDPQWSVADRNGNARSFGNPIRQASRQAECLAREAGCRVEAIVCMAGRARTDGSPWPYGAVGIEALPRILGGKARNPQGDGSSPEEVAEGWARVRRLASLDEDGSVSRRHGERLDRRRTPDVPHQRRWLRSAPLAGGIALLAAWWAVSRTSPTDITASPPAVEASPDASRSSGPSEPLPLPPPPAPPPPRRPGR